MNSPRLPATVITSEIARSSAPGLAAQVILTGFVPFMILQSLVPVLHNGLNIWMSSLLPVLGVSAIVATIMGFALVRQWAGYPRFVYVLGRLLLAAYALGICLDVAMLFGVISKVSPDLAFMNVVNIVLWMLFCPLNWLMWRTLRQPFWRP